MNHNWKKIQYGISGTQNLKFQEEVEWMDITTTAINHYLDNLGVKHTYTGYRYLVEAIRLGVECNHAIGIMKIYEQIAQSHNTKSSLVERAIRSATNSFGLTNKEFISKAIDDIIYSSGESGDYGKVQDSEKIRIPVTMKCYSMAEVKENVDRIDNEIVKLIYERQMYVIQSSVFKKSEDEMISPDRSEALIHNFRV